MLGEDLDDDKEPGLQVDPETRALLEAAGECLDCHHLTPPAPAISSVAVAVDPIQRAPQAATLLTTHAVEQQFLIKRLRFPLD